MLRGTTKLTSRFFTPTILRRSVLNLGANQFRPVLNQFVRNNGVAGGSQQSSKTNQQNQTNQQARQEDQKQNNNTNQNKRNVLREPTFYTALSTVGGVLSYTYNEHLRRKQILINTAKGILADLKQSYDAASKATFQMEYKISETGKSKSPPGFTKEERLSFAGFAEQQYRIMLASDTRMTNPKLRIAVEDSFNNLLKLLFSPDFETNPLVAKECIGHYFLLHQLIIGYEKSLSEFISNISQAYIFNQSSFDKLYKAQEEAIANANKAAKAQVFDKNPMDVYLNLTKIFRQNHFDGRLTPENTKPAYTPKP